MSNRNSILAVINGRAADALFARLIYSVQVQGACACPRNMRHLLRRQHPGRFL